MHRRGLRAPEKKTAHKKRPFPNRLLQQAGNAHNERKKESYSNPDIIPERTPLNVHFKSPGGTYLELFDALEQDKIISTWGMKPDSTKLCEPAFDVNFMQNFFFKILFQKI